MVKKLTSKISFLLAISISALSLSACSNNNSSQSENGASASSASTESISASSADTDSSSSNEDISDNTTSDIVIDDTEAIGIKTVDSNGDYYKDKQVYVQKIDGLSEDFMRGVDISSFLSEIESGVVFKDYEGNDIDSQGFFDLLADSGVNYVRIRVWNDPYDENGNGYGGGNCDIDRAISMGEYATNAGMKVYIDFHYSDFWYWL